MPRGTAGVEGRGSTRERLTAGPGERHRAGLAIHGADDVIHRAVHRRGSTLRRTIDHMSHMRLI
ncbi:deoxyuridine 5'-triphosphate nucleotidohydrolase [Actinomyces sp. Chiba101]|nr:deoxyuridine 5'-triphosphate nucleotidohydrolase [Actinomyces sp. Chiba101]GAV95194.1 Deoxyuridine 5'-triphosphate nucleotidohydrolase [Actinomyces denticolens]